MTAKDEPRTLTDADICPERTISRRSVLGTLGIGAGVAVLAAFGAVTRGETAVVDRTTGDIIGSPAATKRKGKALKANKSTKRK